jgi:hypothetical protein
MGAARRSIIPRFLRRRAERWKRAFNLDLPLLVAGHAGGLRGGRHIASEARTPVANLFVQLMNSAGVGTEHFADSTGQLDLRA